MMSVLDGFVIAPQPAVHIGAGAIARLPGAVRATGAGTVVVVTDAVLAATPVLAAVLAVLAAAGIPASVFSGIRAAPTTDDLAAGAEAVTAAAAGAAALAEAATVTATLKASAPFAAPSVHSAPPLAPSASRIALVAVGGGSPIDAAKGIALAAVNPQRGRDLDYRGDFAVPALPMVAVPTTAGAGAETTAFGEVTDPRSHRRFCVGHASSMPAGAILDPALTVGLPQAVTAATGMHALTHALESYLSLHPNPWSDGIARQAIQMIAANLPQACADGTDLAARSQMLLAAHMAGLAVTNTGVGLCHAIGHSLAGRWDIGRGAALALLLPGWLRFYLPVRVQRLADLAFAFGVGDTRAGADRNAAAAIDAVAALRARIGLTRTIADFGVTEADFAQVARDALDDDTLTDTARRPAASDIEAILAACAAAP